VSLWQAIAYNTGPAKKNVLFNAFMSLWQQGDHKGKEFVT
jgi:hypothetical protein